MRLAVSSGHVIIESRGSGDENGPQSLLLCALPFVVTSVTHDGYTVVGSKLKGRWYTIHFIS